MEMTLVQRAVAFVAIVFLFLLVCFAFWAADPLRLTTLSGEYSERTINSPGGSRRIWILDFDPTFRPA